MINQINTLKSNNNALLQKIQTLESTNDNNSKKLAECQENLTKSNTNLNTCLLDNDKLNKNNIKLLSDIKLKDLKIQTLEAEIINKNNELISLRNLNEQLSSELKSNNPQIYYGDDYYIINNDKLNKKKVPIYLQSPINENDPFSLFMKNSIKI